MKYTLTCSRSGVTSTLLLDIYDDTNFCVRWLSKRDYFMTSRYVSDQYIHTFKIAESESIDELIGIAAMEALK